jgi:general secretion pathway protein J
MKRLFKQGRVGEGGFTLIETLVSLALMGLVLSALANLTAQWLPNWNRGLDRIQRSELIGIALQRIGADLAAAEYVPANRSADRPLFDGSELSVTFVRTAVGPNAGLGLDIVRFGETTDRQGFATVRSQTPFRPVPLAASLSEQLHFGEPVLILRAPFRLSFAYAGPDRIWHDNWHNADRLPAAVKLTIRDAASERILAISTVTPIHAQSPAQGDEKSDTSDKPGATAPSSSQGKPEGNSQGGAQSMNTAAALGGGR